MIIFVGVAGAGKSVQGKLLAQDINAPYFSMGEFLRSHVDDGLQKKLITGDLINDEEAIRVLEGALVENNIANNEFILDGFPRTVMQTSWLVEQYKTDKIKIKAVFHLLASPEVILPRLLERHRPDDLPEVINKRVGEYQESIQDIVKMLEEGGIKVFEINGERTPEEIHAEIMQFLAKA